MSERGLKGCKKGLHRVLLWGLDKALQGFIGFLFFKDLIAETLNLKQSVNHKP